MTPKKKNTFAPCLPVHGITVPCTFFGSPLLQYGIRMQIHAIIHRVQVCKGHREGLNEAEHCLYNHIVSVGNDTTG